MMNKPKKPSPQIKRNEGRHQDKNERIKNFDEVALGFNLEEALIESSRCLNCKTRPCEKACPVNIKVPDFITHLYNEDIQSAVLKIYETSLFPAICGRVCPQENYCEAACVLKDRFGSVSIGRLERFVSDHARKNNMLKLPECEKENGFKVACVGSGPASLSVAAELRKKGYDITVFEALHEFGGVLRYGIPPFRLPREVVNFEIENLKKMGVKFIKNILIGKSVSLDDLRQDFDAVFVGSGAGLPSPLGVKGEDLIGVYSSNEFLTRVNLMKGYKFPDYDTPIYVGKRVVVVGGGNTAMDSARCAKRLGPENVTVLYRRTKAEMPARAEEVENAIEEGINFEFLTAPVELEGDENGRLKRVKCIRMELGEKDQSGRRKPVPIKGSEFYIDTDVIIAAIGQSPNPLIQQTTKIETNKWNCLVVNENGQTSIENVFAGGDVVRGGATVLLAMKDGKVAANAIDEYLMEEKWNTNLRKDIK
jgi:glutamate synthase (NADPH/NADH) small chain